MSEPGPLLLALKDAAREHMLDELPDATAAKVPHEDFRALHQFYATWRGRIPTARPRRVHVSRELGEHPDRGSYEDGLAAVSRDIEQGVSLQPRMSTGTARPMSVDRLLADWGLHHLHLKTAPHPKLAGFTDRSDHLLFAAFMPDDAYLIDLVRHESDGANWAALHVLEVVVRNWPDSGVLIPSNYATGIKGGNWTDDDRRALRVAGLSTGMVEIEGRVWAAGLRGAGARLPIAQHCMRVSWILSGYEPTEDQVRSDLAAIAEKHGKPNDWRAIVYGEDFGFYSDGLFVPYGSLLP